MKRYIRWSLFLIICNMCIISCNFLETEPCNMIICDNGGFCNEGTCICPLGFEGLQCSIFSRTKFIGNYKLVITDELMAYDTMDTEIKVFPGDHLKLQFNFDFMNPMYPSHAEFILDGERTFDFPEQTINSFFEAHEGQGSIDENGIINIETVTEVDAKSITYVLLPQ